MKLKPSETVFVVICMLAAAAAIFAVALARGHSGDTLRVSLAETEGEQYDISVLNSATAEDFMQIRGIGEVRTKEIIEYRTAIGGFRRIGQLCDISGIGESAMALIIEHFYGEGENTSSAETTAQEPQSTVPESETRTPEQTSPPVTSVLPETSAEPSAAVTEEAPHEVDINEATAEELEKALLITPKLAEEIVELREKIGYFSSVQELYLCDGFDDKIYKKVKNHVKIGE